MTETDSPHAADSLDDAQMVAVQGPQEIPHFASEAEEQAFWTNHSIGEKWFAHVLALPHNQRRVPVWARLRDAAILQQRAGEP